MSEITWTADLDDMDDEMTVDLAGPCSIDGTDVDPDTGLCAEGHDDLDRADAAQPGTTAAVMTEAEALARLLNAGGIGVVDVTVTPVIRPGTAEAVADVARGLGLDETATARLVAAAGLCNDCGDQIHQAGETCPAVSRCAGAAASRTRRTSGGRSWPGSSSPAPSWPPGPGWAGPSSRTRPARLAPASAGTRTRSR